MKQFIDAAAAAESQEKFGMEKKANAYLGWLKANLLATSTIFIVIQQLSINAFTHTHMRD